MKDDQPVKQRYYPKNPKMQVEINAKIDELLEKGCIEPSRSPYSSPIVMVAAIAQLKPPGNVKELRQYLGVASWYRRFVPDFATLVQPLNALLKKQAKWKLEDAHQAAFEAVKVRLVADPILACPDFTKTFVLQTDASDYGLGAILTQHSERGERVISYSSKTLNTAERNYSAMEKECLATVITDHMALKWLNNIESPSGRIARWALEPQQYDFEISYRKGQLKIVADALSRQPLQETSRRVSVEDDGQPREQQGCKWLEEMRRKVEQQPEKFPDYLEEDGKLYRHIPHRAGNEEDTWEAARRLPGLQPCIIGRECIGT
ncbi:GM19305 [Drosophila sechellia]|uniref:RNA-directed DNA polymerase n=1 Tax=Drosophila sechellia TaxID=7238 RepID=B4IN21_DROSE|nr:GM19305 [Drosophila sechellia]